MASPRRTAPPPAKKQRSTRARSPHPPVPASFARASVVAAVKAATEEAVAPHEVSSVLSDAREILLTDDGASWLYVVPQWYAHIYALRHCDDEEENAGRAYSDWFDAVWNLHPRECGTIKLFGKPIRTPRYQQAYGVTHHFSGATFPSLPFPPELQHAVATMQRMLVVDEVGGEKENNGEDGGSSEAKTCLRAGLVNWYADGDHYMGPHSDEGANVRTGSPIFSLTLGPAVRRFVFTPRGAAHVANSKTNDKVEFELRDGDLLVMGGTTQQTHKHALPKMKRCRARRVNVTLRYFK